MSLRSAKVLLTGAGGMLASEVAPLLKRAGADVLATDANVASGLFTLDICDKQAVSEYLRREKPDWIVNCAAYTKVDDAEKEYGTAFQVNSIGPMFLAQAADETGARLLHISSDYVFGGSVLNPNSRIPLSEEASPAPCGLYGHSKRFGDELVLSNLPQHALVVRTSWLHGVHGPNFIETILRISAEREEIRVVNDQWGSPTWAKWLAETLISLMSKNASGVFHATSRGGITWFDFAKELLEQAGMSTKVLPQTSEELARPAPRPPYSVLSVKKLEEFLGEDCISWQECVRGHLAQLRELGRLP